MKILLVQNTDWIKRNPAHQHHLAEILSVRGHEIRVIDYKILWRSVSKRGLWSKKQVFKDVFKIHKNAKITVVRPGIIQVPLLDYFSLQFTQRGEIKTQMKEFKPDVVLAMGLSGLWAEMAARKSGVPFVNFWIDASHRLIPLKLAQPLGLMIEKRIAKRADKSLAINDKLVNYVIKLGARPERTAVVRPGVDISKFNPALMSSVRNKLGIHKDDIVLFFVGWLYRFAGLKEVILSLAKNTNPKIKLLIVGEGDAFSELKQMIETYHLQGRLIMTGQKPYEEVPEYIASADICILPSYPWEPIMQDIVPIKLYDYMAMGKPVICTKLPGVMKEFGTENGMVFVDKPEDVISKAVELKSTNSLSDLGAMARRFAERNSWDKITDRFENILLKSIKEMSK